MSDALIVFGKILETMLVIAIGWIARRVAFIKEQTASALSRIVTDIAFPCMAFTQLLRTVSPDVLARDWYLPLLGAGIILGSALLGFATMPLFANRDRRATYIFLVATPNWIFLPLPMADALYGANGVSIILLLGVGAQLAFWSVGVTILRGRAPDQKTWLDLLKNPGLIACVAGLIVAWQIPAAQECLISQTAARNFLFYPAAALLRAAESFGSITIPVSLFLIGSAMGSMQTSTESNIREQVGLILSRLILPLPVALIFFKIMTMAGCQMPAMTQNLVCLVACMPVAITCSVIAERFGGHPQLAARAIFSTSLISIATIPGVVALAAYLTF